MPHTFPLSVLLIYSLASPFLRALSILQLNTTSDIPPCENGEQVVFVVGFGSSNMHIDTVHGFN